MHPEPGGHYAAHLEPEVLADDIREFFRRFAARSRARRLASLPGAGEEAPAV
jgi:hypothetical protein